MIASGFELDDQSSEGSGARRVALSGELDAHAAQGLAASIADDLGADDRVVHLDMDALHFIDSAGLRALVELDQQLREQGRHLVLERPSETVRQVLRIADLESHFEIRDA